MDILTLALSKKYIDESILGVNGVLAGKNCTIERIEPINNGHRVVFAWTADTGEKRTDTLELYNGTAGASGAKGDKGDKGDTGDKGSDGFTPTIAENPTNNSDVYRLDITNSTGTITTPNLKGSGGGGEAKVYDKYVIVAVAGQSNAVGYDESALTLMDVAYNNRRIFQLGNVEDRDDEQVDDSANTTWTPQIKPLDYCATNLQRMRRNVLSTRDGRGFNGTKGMHLPLANQILRFIPDDYAVLIIPCAYGATSVKASNSYSDPNVLWGGDASNGTGKSRDYDWGPNSKSSYILQNRIKWALEQNPNNIFAGIIWLQGENDNGSVQANTTGFPAMVEQINNSLRSFAGQSSKRVIDKSLWFAVESTYHWMDQSGCAQIWENYKQYLGEDNYVEIPRDQDIVNTTAYTSSTRQAHFGVNAYRTVIVPRIVEKMLIAGVLPMSMPEKSAAGGTAEVPVGLVDHVDYMNESMNSMADYMANIAKLVKEQHTDVETRLTVDPNSLTGYGEWEASGTGINFAGTLGNRVRATYVPAGYTACYFDSNAPNEKTGLVIGIIPENNSFLWIYMSNSKPWMFYSVEGENQTAAFARLTNNDFAVSMGNNRSFKVVRNGTKIKISWREIGTTGEYTELGEGDVSAAIAAAGGSVDTFQWKFGACVGWSEFTKPDTSKPLFDNFKVAIE